MRELKVLVEAAKAGEARGEAFARLRSDAEAGGRRMLALMVALALRRHIEREPPGQSRDDGSRARTVRRRTR